MVNIKVNLHKKAKKLDKSLHICLEMTNFAAEIKLKLRKVCR